MSEQACIWRVNEWWNIGEENGENGRRFGGRRIKEGMLKKEWQERRTEGMSEITLDVWKHSNTKRNIILRNQSNFYLAPPVNTLYTSICTCASNAAVMEWKKYSIH